MFPFRLFLPAGDIFVTISRGFVSGQKHCRFTNPPICNSVHSNKVTPTEANSLPLTRRRESLTQTWNTLTFTNSGGLSLCSAATVEVVYEELFPPISVSAAPPESAADLHSVGLFAIPRLSARCQVSVQETRGISGLNLQSKADEPVMFGGSELRQSSW